MQSKDGSVAGRSTRANYKSAFRTTLAADLGLSHDRMHVFDVFASMPDVVLKKVNGHQVYTLMPGVAASHSASGSSFASGVPVGGAGASVATVVAIAHVVPRSSVRFHLSAADGEGEEKAKEKANVMAKQLMSVSSTAVMPLAKRTLRQGNLHIFVDNSNVCIGAQVRA
jgi:hypothetical protein